MAEATQSKLHLLADQPEVMALAMVSSVAASTIAAAFNDGDNFFDHMSMEELTRLQSACTRMAVLQTEMGRSLSIWIDLMRRHLESAPKETQ